MVLPKYEIVYQFVDIEMAQLVKVPTFRAPLLLHDR